MIDQRRPPARRRKRVAVVVVLIVIALIAVIFIGENMAQMNDKGRERQVPQPQGGVQQVTPARGPGPARR